MEPLAPALLSITMPTPSAAPSSLEMIRVVVSVPLPAAKGSTSVMLRVGQAGVCASATELRPARARANTAAREVTKIIPVPPPDFVVERLVIRQASLRGGKEEAGTPPRLPQDSRYWLMPMPDATR